MSPRLSLFLGISLASSIVLPAAEDELKLHLHKWSGKINVPDPVAVAVDPQGRVYVTHTTRRKVADLDIREFPEWIEKDVSLDSIEAKRAFYHDILAPNKGFKAKGSLADHNKDGSVDWKDLTVHSEIIYRLEDKDGDGEADEMTVFADGFNTEVTGIAAGILYHDGWIYTTIAPDLWRLKDTDGDGKADIRESIVHGFGHHIAYAGHDMHGLAVGPDGRIYWTIGDKATNVKTKEGKVVKAPFEGALLRCEPDGSNFEIYARGLRNVQEIAFDDFGNVLGVDNDADKPGEKERLLYIVEGSDTGWRCSYQYMKGYIPWMDENLTVSHREDQPAYLTPPLSSYHDGPAGFAFNPGTALSERWNGRFFCNQFPSGKLNSFKLNTNGAGFEVEDDKVVSSGVMGIGMSWHPDGSLFMADWMGGYPLDEKGAVWKVDVADNEKNPERIKTLQFLRQDYTKADKADLLSQLSYPDQRVRRGAQFELVKRKAFSDLEKIALDTKQGLLARVHAIWGLGQGWRNQSYDLTAILIQLLSEAGQPEILVQSLKVYADRQSEVPSEIAERIIALINDRAQPRVAFQASLTAGKLKLQKSFDALIKAIEANAGKDAYLRHAFIVGLEGSALKEEKLAELSKSASKEVRLSAVVALRRLQSDKVQLFLNDKDLEVQAEAARAIYDDESIVAALPALSDKIVLDKQVEASSEPLYRRVLGANYRLGKRENLTRLVDFALSETASVCLRKEALTLIDQWVKPSNLDRVDGHYRKLEPRDSAELREVLSPQMDQLLSLENVELKTLAVSILANHELNVNPQLAAAAVLEEQGDTDLRAKTLQLLGKQAPKSTVLKDAVDKLLSTKQGASLHRVSLEIVAEQFPEELAKYVAKVMEVGSVSARQRAIELVGASKLSDTLGQLEGWFRQFRDGKLSKNWELEVVEAVRLRAMESNQLSDLWNAYQQELTPFVAQPSKGELKVLLEGGDAEKGMRIVNEHLAANCIACHRVSGNTGSTVGPALNSIGKTRDRAYLLRALVEPNAEVAAGFGVVTAQLKSGEVVSGALMSQKKENCEIRLADGSVKTFKNEEIVSISPPVSVMPPMNLLLTKKEIRDVVEFLSSLKPKEKGKK